MISAASLIAVIRREFAVVPFPLRCGLHAAMAKDDWLDDEEVLAEITQREDFIGEWWKVPVKHLRSCMMALSYLDADGIAFYLPAYMKALVETPEDFDVGNRSSSWQVVFTMLPDRTEPELEQHFRQRFSLVHGGRRRVCSEFLRYVATNDAYDEHASEIAKEALKDEFWSRES